VKYFLGVDWGTHSSKWACSEFDGTQHRYLRIPPIVSSDIEHVGDSFAFGRELGDADTATRFLKRVLIQDPLGPDFWNAERVDCCSSLGEAVSFSLCCLLVDALASLNLPLDGPGVELDIAFSLPNWVVNVDRPYKVATANFLSSAAVAAHVALTNPLQALPHPGVDFPLQEWKRLVAAARKGGVAMTQPAMETLMQTRYATPVSNVCWGLINESGAAGLPYLRNLEIETELGSPGVPGLAKLLVIDVGAGSTDVGYMLRVRNRIKGNECLYILPPAASFGVAGNHLTEELVGHLRSQGQLVGRSDAEAQKIRSWATWQDLPFAEQWRSQIARQVQAYVQGVPDLLWLLRAMPLNIVLTGGSGLVPGLAGRIRDAVVEGLRLRGADPQALVTTTEHSLRGLALGDMAEYGRRAVCLGASDSDRPGCKYVAQLDPPAPPRNRAPVRAWV